MVVETDIAKLLGDMNSIAESLISMKLQAHGQFVEAIREVMQQYFQDYPMPASVKPLAVVC
jgi:hypothetical protein